MAAKGTIGGKIVLEGEKEYRDALKGIKKEQAELRSEMKLASSTFKNSQNSLDALQKKYEILTKQVDKASDKLKLNQAAVETWQKKQEDAAAKVERLKTELETEEKTLAEMKKTYGESSEAVQKKAAAVEELKGKLASAQAEQVKATEKVTDYKTAVNYAEAELKELEAEVETTAKHIGEAERSTDKCATSIDEYGKEAEKATQKTSVFGDVLKANLASELIIAGAKKLAGAIKEIATSAIDVGGEFEASMSQVAATMGMTAEEVANGSKSYELLSDAAKKSGRETIYSASQAAEALNYLALAGYDAATAAQTLPKVLTLASAGGMELAYASDLVTDSMSALGMETQQLDGYIDQMARTAQKSNTSVAQLGEASLVCAGAVNTTNQDIVTMNTQLGILANNGIKGAEGGTHLRNVILSLAAPTDNAAKQLKQLGVDVVDSGGNMRDLNDIMIDLNAALADMGSAEKAAAIKTIFNKTDIAAVNALLKGSGEEYNNLRQEIENASGAAANMAATMNDNLKGKVTQLNSALEGLGISVYEVFDDALKDSVDGATSAVARLQRAVEHGDLGASLDKMSKAMGNLIDRAIDFGEDALPVVIDALTWLIDNSDLVISGLTGIAAAHVWVSTIAPAITAAKTAWIAYQAANEGATVAQWLLNAAMAANPVGLLITGIVALTAAVAAFCFWNRDNFNTMSDVCKASKEQAEAAQELNEAYAEGNAARQQTRASMESEVATTRALAQELQGLQKKTQLTEQEQLRQKMIVEQLNATMPELALTIDETTGKLTEMSAAALESVDAMLELQKAQAAQEDMAAIAAEQYESEKMLYELEKQLEEQKLAVAEAQEAYNAVIEDGIDWFGSSYNALQNEKDAQAELEAQIEATRATMAAQEEEYARAQEYVNAATESYNEMTASVDDAADGVDQATDRMAEAFANLSEAQQKLLEDTIEAVGSFNGIFDEMAQEADMSLGEISQNLENNAAAMQQYAENIEKATNDARYSTDENYKAMVDSIIAAGVDSAAYLDEFVRGAEENSQEFQDMIANYGQYAEAVAKAQEALATEWQAGAERMGEEVRDSFQTAGENSVEGFSNGITENASDAADAASDMGDDTVEALEDSLETHSPSKRTEEAGRNFDEGLTHGIDANKADVITTAGNLGGEMITELETQITTSRMAEIGKQVPAGIAQGIREGKSQAINEVRDLCTEMLNTAKQTLKISSPSKEFEYTGEMSGEGVVVGWRKKAAQIKAVIAETMRGAVSGSREGIEGADAVAGRSGGVSYAGSEGRTIEVRQEINILAPADDLIEQERAFKRAQQEAAMAW